MNSDELILAKRTIVGDHLLKRTPYNQIVAALSLALFIAVLVTAGWIWLLVTFVVWCAALMYFGHASMQRALALLTREREEERQAHEATLAGRRALATMPDVTYEEQSAEVAARFGRLDQTVPRHALPEEAQRTRHTAELVARGVVRTTLRGFPVTVFDLEVAHESDLGVLSRKTRFERAFDLCTCYLTVCAVTLPFPLPHLSALAAWSPGMVETYAGGPVNEAERGVPPELRHTDDPEFADLMLSVPAVRRAAHDLKLLWTISGDVLTTSVITPSGLPVPTVLQRATVLAELAEAFPWNRLETYRRTAPQAPWPLHRSPLLAHEWWRPATELDHAVLRWWHHPLGKTGVRAFRSTSLTVGDPR